MKEMDELKKQQGEMRGMVAEKEAEHEQFLTEQALKQNDWYTKHALRKLLSEQQEQLTKTEKAKEED